MTPAGQERTPDRPVPPCALERHPPYAYRADPRVRTFPDDKPLIVFDGVCVLCNGFARFVVARDTDRAFRFTHAQTPLGQGLLSHYGLDPDALETVLLIEDGRAYGKLEAALAILRRIGGPWRLAAALRAVPRRVRDWLYDRLARNRYRLFGRHEVCLMPGVLHDRFID